MKRKRLLVAGVLMNAVLLGACMGSDDGTSVTEDAHSSAETPSNDHTEDTSETETNFGQEPTEEAGLPLDMEQDILTPSSLAVLANKQYSLEEDYAPEDLVTVEVPTVLEDPEIKQMRKEAADALKDMFDAAEKDGITLFARSGYRSYQTQVSLFQNYVSNHGEEAANKYSARPGQSEHQTGLAMDVTSESVNYQLTEEFGNTPEGEWVRENAHRYGFIIRYPKGKEAITGYIFEPWHLRYLGGELAAEVHESGLTYEEYLAKKGLDIEIAE